MPNHSLSMAWATATVICSRVTWSGRQFVELAARPTSSIPASKTAADVVRVDGLEDRGAIAGMIRKGAGSEIALASSLKKPSPFPKIVEERMITHSGELPMTACSPRHLLIR